MIGSPKDWSSSPKPNAPDGAGWGGVWKSPPRPGAVVFGAAASGGGAGRTLAGVDLLRRAGRGRGRRAATGRRRGSSGPTTCWSMAAKSRAFCWNAITGSVPDLSWWESASTCSRPRGFRSANTRACGSLAMMTTNDGGHRIERRIGGCFAPAKTWKGFTRAGRKAFLGSCTLASDAAACRHAGDNEQHHVSKRKAAPCGAAF